MSKQRGTTSWRVVKVMEACRWGNVYACDHFIPPWRYTAQIKEHELLNTLEGWMLIAAIAAVTQKLQLKLRRQPFSLPLRRAARAAMPAG